MNTSDFPRPHPNNPTPLAILGRAKNPRVRPASPPWIFRCAENDGPWDGLVILRSPLNTIARLGIVVALSVLALRDPVSAADARKAMGPPVELPPMLVEESTAAVPWLYVHAGGTEFLSRCSASTTRQFVDAWLAKMQLVRALVPDEFFARMDVPAVFVLYAQDLKQTVSAEIQRELQAGEEPARRGDARRETRVNIAPNMRLSDRDMQASIVYIDETLFDAAGLSVAPAHVRFLLQRRVPELPAWAIEGIERTWRGADFVLEPITLRPLGWRVGGEGEALARDATHPRTLLPANELFANDALRSSENRHARRVETRSSTQELFFRWAIVGGGATRDAFWKFVARAAEGPVTERDFEAMFGFDFAELRDRLSDYLPKAVEETKWIDPGALPPLPRIDVERATPNEIARVRGEWERLAIAHVQSRLPAVREPYIAQARRTLRRAYDAGDRDPRLLATMGLCEIDAGNPAGAREFLEPATALGVLRPRAHHELARLRFAELRRAAPEKKSFSYTELAPIIGPLRRAATQAPPLPEAFTLLAEAWGRCETPPNTEEWAELLAGARLFARRPAVAFPIALALARHGKNGEAAAVRDACADYAADEATRAAVTRWRAELAAAMASQ
jgi:hypothetical protein